ncbi:hypothetical protein AZJ33_00445 [Streptococcus pneumoniae]|uniref:Uncharacterized protein n=1 Tax=Streptococcus pneumoniae TaxID=1313 RepID=A0A559H945_STREE|nr:hypothetical protein U754_11855 [Streptococcus pneumoniae 13856]KXV83484.1 hypothetical protein NTPn2_05075 [Streptococcus pneumoniae]OYL05671.1 hypothetical protein AK85_15270 [Streptococcus pneumoniae B1598]OYL06161.1 hypothetical protein AK86_12245 [Streptococcus pneumoniae B1599]KXV86345.1 hypothetical protein NTPn27_00460 [Streptococcus pneumoniae]
MFNIKWTRIGKKMPENGIIGRKCFDREDIRDEFSTIIQSAILDQFVCKSMDDSYQSD